MKTVYRTHVPHTDASLMLFVAHREVDIQMLSQAFQLLDTEQKGYITKEVHNSVHSSPIC